jgi:hypothetical protein
MSVENYPTIAKAVQGWLLGEHDYQFSKFDSIYGKELAARRDFIADTEIANKWRRNVVLREGGAFMLANQQVLKVCAAARAVLVYDVCLEGGNREEASNITFEVIRQHFDELNSDDLDPSQLYETYERAFPNPNHKAVFKRAGELAILGVAEYEAITNEVLLPQPGLSSGNWQ